jgi:hypothetical protein
MVQTQRGRLHVVLNRWLACLLALSELVLALLAQPAALVLDFLGLLPAARFVVLLVHFGLFEGALALLELIDHVLALVVIAFEALVACGLYA